MSAPDPAVVETVARVIWAADGFPGPTWEDDAEGNREDYRRLAAAAIAALPPSPAEEAVKRVEALAESWRYKGEHGWGPWQEGYGPGPADSILDQASADLRAALASPTPAPESTELPPCNLRSCPEGDGDHRITIGRCIVAPAPRDRYAQCDDTCTVDCGACKGAGPR